MRKKLLLGLTTVALTMTSQAFGADEDPNIVLIEARQGDMEIRAFSAGPLFMMAKGKIPYDAETAAKLANNLKLLSTLR